MFGYIKKNEVIDLLESELRITDRQRSVNAKLAAMADNDAEKTNYWNMSEEYQIRFDQTQRILDKIRRSI